MNKTLSNWFKRWLSQPEALTLVVIFLLTIIAFKVIGQVFGPIVVSLVIAYILFGLVRKLEDLHFPYLFAVISVFSLFIGCLLLAILWLFPMLWKQLVGLVDLVSQLPLFVDKGQSLVLKVHNLFPKLVSVEQLQKIMVHLTDYLISFKGLVTFSLASLFGAFSVVIYLVLVPLLVFFFLRDGKDIIKWCAQFLPKKRTVLNAVWKEMHVKISGYIRGKAIEIVVVAIVTMIAFGILGLRYAMLLGALVGLSVVVPYVGIVVVTVPIVVVGLIQWGFSSTFLYLILIHALISILDANLFVPVLFSGVMNLHPLAIILAVLIFGALFGFWGVFFAIPLVTLFNVIIKAWPKIESG